MCTFCSGINVTKSWNWNICNSPFSEPLGAMLCALDTARYLHTGCTLPLLQRLHRPRADWCIPVSPGEGNREDGHCVLQKAFFISCLSHRRWNWAQREKNFPVFHTTDDAIPLLAECQLRCSGGHGLAMETIIWSSEHTAVADGADAWMYGSATGMNYFRNI